MTSPIVLPEISAEPCGMAIKGTLVHKIYFRKIFCLTLAMRSVPELLSAVTPESCGRPGGLRTRCSCGAGPGCHSEPLTGDLNGGQKENWQRLASRRTRPANFFLSAAAHSRFTYFLLRQTFVPPSK